MNIKYQYTWVDGVLHLAVPANMFGGSLPMLIGQGLMSMLRKSISCTDVATNLKEMVVQLKYHNTIFARV